MTALRMDVDESPPSPAHSSAVGSASFFRKMLPRWNVGSGWQYLSTTPSEKLLLLPQQQQQPSASRVLDDAAVNGSPNGIVRRATEIAPRPAGLKPRSAAAGSGEANDDAVQPTLYPTSSHKDEWLQALRGFFTRGQASRQAIGRRSPVAQPRNQRPNSSCSSSSSQGNGSTDVPAEAAANDSARPLPRAPRRHDYAMPRQHSFDVAPADKAGAAGGHPLRVWSENAACSEPVTTAQPATTHLYHATPIHAADGSAVRPSSAQPSWPCDGAGGTPPNAAVVQRRPSPRYARQQSTDEHRRDLAPAGPAAVAAACRRNSSRRATVDGSAAAHQLQLLRQQRQNWQQSYIATSDAVLQPSDFGPVGSIDAGTSGGSSGCLTPSETSSSLGSVFAVASATGDQAWICGSDCSLDTRAVGSGLGEIAPAELDSSLGFYDEWSSSLRRFATMRRTAARQLEPPPPASLVVSGDGLRDPTSAVTAAAAAASLLTAAKPILLLQSGLMTEATQSSANSVLAAGSAGQRAASYSYSVTHQQQQPSIRPRTGSTGQQQKSRTPRLFRRGLQMLTERARNSFRSTSRRDLEKHDLTRKMKTAHSYESLLASGPALPSSDLREGRAQVQPLHASILGQENCFQIVTSAGSTFYACRGAEERDRWIACLRKTINPHEDNVRRTDVSLKLWIQEAKNCQAKKRYFCEIALDRTVYARTSTKTKGEMLFWGEQFEFDNLPPINSLTLTLFKEKSDKRKLRQVWPGSSDGDRGALAIGCISIPVSELLNRQVSEHWYSVVPLPASSSSGTNKSNRDSKTASSNSTTGTASASGDGMPQIRVKARYQAVRVLPLALYNDLSQYVQHNYLSLVAELEPLLPVRAKDDVATVLVNILHHEGKATTFLCDIVMADVLKQENSHVVFRGNTIATKAIEAYMKLVSSGYLRSTLGECVRTILESGDDCEVDPSKLLGSGSGSSVGSVSQSVLTKHRACLVKYCEQVWAKIAGSLAQFPSELRDVFAAFRGRCRELGKADLADNLISACVFLRLLCPAIMSPNLFGLCQEFPDERASRTLTLVAKTIQSLANFTKFGGKEDYMLHMNEFVDREWARMHEYLQKISSIDSKYRRVDYQGRIDVAKHLSLLHSLLIEEARADGGGAAGGGASVAASSVACSGAAAAGTQTELRRRLQSLLQRLTDELLHGEDSSILPSAAVGDGSAAAAAATGERRAAAAQSGSVRRSRPLSAGDHAAVVVAKDGCVPPAASSSAVRAAATTSSTAAPPAAAAADASVRAKDVQSAEMLPPWSSSRQAATQLSSAVVATSGEKQMTTTGSHCNRLTNCLLVHTDGSCSSSSGVGSAASGGGGSGGGGTPGGRGPAIEPAVDSAYDTLRSVGSQSDAATGSVCSSSGAGSHVGGPSEALCNAQSCGSGSFPSAKKVVLHKVWDRVLTANDLITGDYVDLISYLDDGLSSSTDSCGPTLTTTSTTAAALLSGGHSAPTTIGSREGSVSDGTVPNRLLGSETLSKKGTGSATTAGTPVRQAPLTFFNPAFRPGATSTSQTPDTAATSMPFCQSYPGHLSREASNANGSIGGTPKSQRPSQWPPSDRFGSLTSRGKQDLPLVTTTPQQPRPLVLQQHPSGAGTTLAVTVAACPPPSQQQTTAPFSMARRTTAGGGGGSSGSTGSSSCAVDVSSVAGRTASPALPPRLTVPSLDAQSQHVALVATEPADGISSRRDVSPGESSTWSKGMSAVQGGCAGRDQDWHPSSSGGAYHRSHLDVHTGRGAQQHIVGTAAAVDGSRTLPVPRRPHGSSPDPERESVELLKHQVEDAQRRLVDTEQRLAQQAEHTDRTIHEWRQRLEASEESLRLQARTKDEQIEGIVQRLMAIEEEVRREQREMKDALTQKQRVIELQESKIRLLNEANNDLLDSLRVLRDHVVHQPAALIAPTQQSLLLQRSSPNLLQGRSDCLAASAASPECDVQPSTATVGRRFKTTLYYSQTGGTGGSTDCQPLGPSS